MSFLVPGNDRINEVSSALNDHFQKFRLIQGINANTFCLIAKRVQEFTALLCDFYCDAKNQNIIWPEYPAGWLIYIVKQFSNCLYSVFTISTYYNVIHIF